MLYSLGAANDARRAGIRYRYVPCLRCGDNVSIRADAKVMPGHPLCAKCSMPWVMVRKTLRNPGWDIRD